MFLVFSKLCPSSISCLFFKPFPAFSYGFSFPSCNFLIFPLVSSIFLGFSKLAIHFFVHFNVQHVPPFSSIFCNPSPLLPRHHSSSPCKLSCSEPQRSVELRNLVFQYACLYVPSFFKALPFLHFMPFFQTFSCVFLWFFKSFLPAISSFSHRFPRFPWFFQACHSFFRPF